MRGGTAVRVVAPAGVIADRYRLQRPLGSGASASVWAAADQTLGRSVALKLLSDASAADQRERERLRSEARALASLAHPHIVTVFDYLEAPGLDGSVQPVLVTELLEGRSLQARLAQGPLPWGEALSVCTSTVQNVMVSAADSTTRCSASARSGIEMSAPTTTPVGPTSRAAAIDVLPPPEPTSSTRSPGRNAAASRT